VAEWSDRAPDGWNAWLDEASGASFAARAEFLDALPLALRGTRTSWLLARRGDHLAGAVPLSLSPRWGFTWARSLPFGTYGGPLVSRAEPDPVLVRALLARGLGERLERERVAGGEIVHAPDDEATDAAWQGMASAVTSGTTHVIDLQRGHDAIVGELHRETRRGLRHAEKSGIVAGVDADALPAAFALYRDQARSWRGHRSFDLPFLRALLAHGEGFARLHVARREGELVCAILALSGGGETFIWWSGSSPAARPALAYPFLVLDIARRAAEAGDRRFNLGGSGGRENLHAFKESLGATPRRLWIYHLAPRRADWRLRLVAWARARRRRP
jgi:hypothetical protein